MSTCTGFWYIYERACEHILIWYLTSTIIYDACDVTLSVYPHRTSLKNMPGATVGIEPTTFGILAQCSAN